MQASSYEQLIVKHLLGNLTPEEEEVFARWLSTHPDHKRLFEEYQQLWLLAEKETLQLNFQTQQEWERLEVSLDQEQEERQDVTQPLTPKTDKWKLWRIAAVVALLLLGTAILVLLKPQEQDLLTRESGSKELFFALADGTQIWLNKGSSLSYSPNFGEHERIVRLQGEAFFAVAHNPQKPFTIQADSARVQVLGTSFNVKAYKDAATAEVLVVTGKVSFAAAQAAKEAVVLEPGEKGVLRKADNVVSKQLSQNANALAWKNNRLLFQKTALHEVIATLEDYFDTRIQVQNQALLNCRFTSTFDDPQLEEVLEVLQHSLNIRILKDGQGWKLEGEGCKPTDV